MDPAGLLGGSGGGGGAGLPGSGGGARGGSKSLSSGPNTRTLQSEDARKTAG